MSLQVKNKVKAFPTMQDVENKIRHGMEIEAADPFDETFAGNLQNQPGVTPGFLIIQLLGFLLTVKRENDSIL